MSNDVLFILALAAVLITGICIGILIGRFN